MLISPAYKALCSTMHVSQPLWGDGARAQDITPLLTYCRELGTKDVLDYGCGKGALAKKFPFPIKEYDPAIPGKESGNVPADIVVCFDVLEHIELECLDDVLADIWRCTNRLANLIIATRPARKFLPDGRNAHLIQEPWSWWQPKIEKYFEILGVQQVSERPNEAPDIQLLVRPRSPEQVGRRKDTIHFDGTENPFASAGQVVNLLDYKMVEFGAYMPVAFFPENLAYSTSQIPLERWFRPDPNVAIKEQRIAVVGYGPSLVDTWEYIKNYDVIVSTSGALNFLKERGITPTYHFEIDWKPHKHKFTENAPEGTRYYISSICSQKIVDNVKDRDSHIMFIEHGDQITYPEGAYIFPSGYDVGQHALVVLKLLGYRHFDLFGFDYCFDMQKRRHAGAHGGRVHHLFQGKVEDKLFYTSKTMFAALLVFERWLETNQDCTISIASDTLLSNFLQGRIRQVAALQAALKQAGELNESPRHAQSN